MKSPFKKWTLKNIYLLKLNLESDDQIGFPVSYVQQTAIILCPQWKLKVVGVFFRSRLEIRQNKNQYFFRNEVKGGTRNLTRGTNTNLTSWACFAWPSQPNSGILKLFKPSKTALLVCSSKYPGTKGLLLKRGGLSKLGTLQ